MAGVAAGIGLLVIGGKSMLDIYEKQEVASNGLKQAVDAHNSSLAIQGRVVVDVTKQEDALIIARNGAKTAQIAYTDAVHKHGAKSQAAQLAAMRLQDAHIRLANAQEALTKAQEKNSAGTQQQKISYDQLQQQIDDFINHNRQYISDQTEVTNGYAKLVRSGLDVNETQRVMNDAVDLAALKHISLSDAVDTLNAAEHGRMKGLIDLGITTKQLTDANGNLLKGQNAVGAAMNEVDKKVAHGRDTLTDMQKSSNDLNNSWQDLAKAGGPKLEGVLADVVGIADLTMKFFQAMGHDNSLWNAIEDRLIAIAKWLRSYIVDPLQWINQNIWIPGATSGPSGSGAPNMGQGQSTRSGRRAGGGPVLPDGTYTVGENGPETLVMGSRGGYVIPNGGGVHHNYNLTLVGQAAVNDPDGVRSMFQRMEALGAG